MVERESLKVGTSGRCKGISAVCVDEVASKMILVCVPPRRGDEVRVECNEWERSNQGNATLQPPHVWRSTVAVNGMEDALVAKQIRSLGYFRGREELDSCSGRVDGEGGGEFVCPVTG